MFTVGAEADGRAGGESSRLSNVASEAAASGQLSEKWDGSVQGILPLRDVPLYGPAGFQFASFGRE